MAYVIRFPTSLLITLDTFIKLTARRQLFVPSSFRGPLVTRNRHLEACGTPLITLGTFNKFTTVTSRARTQAYVPSSFLGSLIARKKHLEAGGTVGTASKTKSVPGFELTERNMQRNKTKISAGSARDYLNQKTTYLLLPEQQYMGPQSTGPMQVHKSGAHRFAYVTRVYLNPKATNLQSKASNLQQYIDPQLTEPIKKIKAYRSAKVTQDYLNQKANYLLSPELQYMSPQLTGPTQVQKSGTDLPATPTQRMKNSTNYSLSGPVPFLTASTFSIRGVMRTKARNFSGPGARNFSTKVKVEEEKVGGVKSLMDLDGPRGWPVVGNFFTYLRKENRGKMHIVQASLHKKYGSMFREKWGPKWQVHLSDPDLIEEVYRREGRTPNRPTIQAWVLYRTANAIPNGITTAQGAEWQLYRQEFTKDLFNQNSINNLVAPLNDVTEDLLLKLDDVISKGGDSALANQLTNILYLWTLEAAGTFLFETRLGCLDTPMPTRTHQFISAMLQMMTSSLYLIIGEDLHRKINSRFWRQHRQAWDVIFKTSKDLINERISKPSNATNSNTTKLSNLYLGQLLKNDKVTRSQIESNISELLIAGSDTTANSLCFLLYLFSRNQDAQKRARLEIQAMRDQISNEPIKDRQFFIEPISSDQTSNEPIKDRQNCDHISNEPISDARISKEPIKDGCILNEPINGGRISNGPISRQQLASLRYVRACIKESLRLYPVVTMNCRILDQDINLRGHVVPKNTLIVMNHYAASRDEKYFSDAESFEPERWMQDEARKRTFASVPFGFGVRSCAGKHVAMLELMLATAKILERYEITCLEGVPFDPILRTLLTPGSRVPIKLRPIK